MTQPTYQPIQGLRATLVDGAESLFKQGEYYIADGKLIMKCPSCRMDNLCPRNLRVDTASWFQRLIGIRKGLTIDPVRCWSCHYGFQCVNSEIYITTEPIHA